MPLTVKKSIDVAAAPDRAWAAIGDFCGIASWHPAVAKCELQRRDGRTYRRLSLKGGGEILEQQSAWDGAGRSYGYTIVESPLPVANYSSTLVVSAKGSGATIAWSGAFDAQGAPDEKAKDVIAGIYDAGLQALAAKLK